MEGSRKLNVIVERFFIVLMVVECKAFVHRSVDM